MGLLILAGVYHANNEATQSVWDADSGRPLHVLSRIIRFEIRDPSAGKMTNWLPSGMFGQVGGVPTTDVQSRP